MPFDLQTVAPADFDPTDETYRITTNADIRDLTASIGAVGLINPLIAAPRKDKLVIVCGFRRFMALQALSAVAIEVRLTDARDRAACARLAITDNSRQRPLNPIEVSRALRLLSSVYTDPERLLQEADALGLPASAAVIARLMPLCRLPQIFQTAILADAISLSMVQELSSLNLEVGEAFVRLFAELQVGLNIQREILTHVVEIARREKIPERAVLSDILGETMADEPPDRSRRLQLVRHRLYRRRYPSISAAETEFQRNLDRLKLAKGVRLIPPKNFESSQFALHLSFRNSAEYERLLDALARLGADPVFRSMMSS